APVRSSKTLFWIVRWFACWLTFGLSCPRMLTPPAEWRTRLFLNVTRCTTDHGAWLPWFLGVKPIAYPVWSAIQRFSKTLPSISTSCAFFSSNRFFTDHRVPFVGGVPAVPAAPLSDRNSAVVIQ